MSSQLAERSAKSESFSRASTIRCLRSREPGTADEGALDLAGFKSSRVESSLKRTTKSSGFDAGLLHPDPISLIQVLPPKLSTKQTGLSRKDFQLLLKKQKRLHAFESQALHHAQYQPGLAQLEARNATLVFAQEAAGTAVCVSDSGLLLTCSHCIAEYEDELDLTARWWLIFSSSQIVEAKCIAWDPRRDLAMLQVVGAERRPGSHTFGTFSHLAIAATRPKTRTRLICIGHPGSEDLEASMPGQETGYDVLHISNGRLRGYVGGQDPQDNSEIGAMKHDCWTYWGHSGAPLVEEDTGCVVGLHSSWDDETAMRHGVPLEAIQGFLRERFPK